MRQRCALSHVITYTIDAGGTDSKGVRRAPGPNPQTGPFYIEGAEPGDTLVVHLLRLEFTRDTGFSTSLLAPYTVDPGFLRQAAIRDPKRITWQIDTEKRIAYVDPGKFEGPRIELPLRPMLGGIGTAPANKAAIPTTTPDNFGAALLLLFVIVVSASSLKTCTACSTRFSRPNQ